MYKWLFAFFALYAIPVNALPTSDNVVSKEDTAEKTKEFVSMNKTVTAAEKAKSMVRPPFMVVPVYPQPFVGSPSLRFQRVVGTPIVVPRFGTSTLGHRLGGYSGYQQQPQMYSAGYIQPASAYTPPFSYQHQPLGPSSTYNYAPYASNSYSSYGYRSAVEDEKLQPPNMDQSMLSTVQYETRYIMKPQDYPADQPQSYANEYNGNNVEYTAVSAPSEMQPREMLWPATTLQNDQRKYEAMIMGTDDRIGSYVAPMSDPTDTDHRVSWEVVNRPYGSGVPETQMLISQQLDDRKFTEPSGRYLSLMRPYGNLMNWENNAAAPLMSW